MPDNCCMGCMKELDAGATVCPHCGFDKNKYVPPEMTLPPGTLLGRGKYLIGKTLGQGGFGVTYIALDRFLKLRVAIKEYLPKSMAYRSESSMSLRWHSSMAEQKLGRDSFVKEAQKMAQMDDIPGIVRVREVFYENNTAYIVMDFVEGETLLRRLEKTGALDGKACFALLRPVMDSLSEAHEQGMIHRDISPDNIMLDKRGRVWLLDMGAAKELDMAQSGQGGHNSTTMIVKPGFSPLEQYASGGNIGPWTDVYAMCATIFYCMSGSTLPLATDRVLNPRLELPAVIPPHISQVLLKGLAVMPDDRIQSMEELRDAFAAALDAPDDAESRRKKEAEARQEAERRQAEEAARQKAEEAYWKERAERMTQEARQRQQDEEAERQRVEEKRQEWQRKIEEAKERAKSRRHKEEVEARQTVEEEAERQRVEEKQREWKRKIAESKERVKARKRQQSQQELQQSHNAGFAEWSVSALGGGLLWLLCVMVMFILMDIFQPGGVEEFIVFIPTGLLFTLPFAFMKRNSRVPVCFLVWLLCVALINIDFNFFIGNGGAFFIASLFAASGALIGIIIKNRRHTPTKPNS